MNTREFYSNKQFRDDDKFPYGISRSGDFSIDESQFLIQHGSLYKAVFENLLPELNEDEIRMIKVYKGNIQATTFEERTWLKYMNYKKRSPIWLCDEDKFLDESADEDFIDDLSDDD
jgi:uncharacterized protein